MPHDPECQDCQALLDEAAVATTQNLRALSRLEVARLRRETDMIPALEAVIRETKRRRESTLAAYKQHLGMHRAVKSGVVA